MLRDRWRVLGIVMGFGAVYDLAFGLAILLFPATAGRVLRLPLPADPIYLFLDGILLVVLAAVYALPARHPERFHPIAPIAAGGRLLGFVLFVAAWRDGRPTTFLLLGIADLALGVVTAVAWLAASRARPSD